MKGSKVFIVHSQKQFKNQVKKLIEINQIDSWFFLGRDARIPYYLEKGLLKNIVRINISKRLSKSQYKNRNIYIKFIDKIEYETGRKKWWDSMLSCKNPWISSFYLRFSQADIFSEITREQVEKGESVLVLVEEYTLFKTINSNYKNSKQFCFFSNKKKLKEAHLLIEGVLRRILAVPMQFLLKIRYNIIFKGNLFNTYDSVKGNLLIIPTFIDQRSFRTGKYSDPFMGKIFENRIIKAKRVIILPIVVSASKQQLKLFNSWLEHNEFGVYFLSNSLSVFYSFLYSIKQLFIWPILSKQQKLLDFNITGLINSERIYEWSKFNLNNHLINRFSYQISKIEVPKIIIYPFENQKWERVLLYSLRQSSKIYAIGIQNAPCPKLSLRYFISKDFVNQVPIPDAIITTGEISFKNLYKNYKNYIDIFQATSARTFISGNKKDENTDIPIKQVLVGCSIGLMESIELITFVISALKNLETELRVIIVPHPLVNFNYSRLLKQLDVPKNIKLSNFGFKEEIKNSDYIIFDSSTVGLEGMLNGITPIFIGHECSVHVNPNEFDQSITKYIYSKIDLINVIKSPNTISEGFHVVSKKYFGENNSKDLVGILISLLNLTCKS